MKLASTKLTLITHDYTYLISLGMQPDDRIRYAEHTRYLPRIPPALPYSHAPRVFLPHPAPSPHPAVRNERRLSDGRVISTRTNKLKQPHRHTKQLQRDYASLEKELARIGWPSRSGKQYGEYGGRLTNHNAASSHTQSPQRWARCVGDAQPDCL